MSEMVHATYSVQNQLLVYAHEAAWVNHNQVASRCAHTELYTEDMCTCVCTFPDVHIRVHPTFRKEQKYLDGYIQAHPPPDEYTRYFHPCCVNPCAPTPG